MTKLASFLKLQNQDICLIFFLLKENCVENKKKSQNKWKKIKKHIVYIALLLNLFLKIV